MTRRRETKANRADRLAHEFELATDRELSLDDWYAVRTGMRLADLECRHDRLPGDPTEPCGCWDEDLERALMTAVRESAKRQEKVYTRSNPQGGRLTDARTTILVSGVPAVIKRRALESGPSLNDEVVGILARHYEVPFKPNGRPSTGGNPDSDRMFLRMPPRLAEKVFRDAVRRRTDKSSVILGVLASHYKVEHTSRSKRTVPFGGGRRQGAAAA